MSKYRHKLGMKESKKIFSSNSFSHPKNLQAVPMRGGFRL